MVIEFTFTQYKKISYIKFKPVIGASSYPKKYFWKSRILPSFLSQTAQKKQKQTGYLSEFILIKELRYFNSDIGFLKRYL